MPSGSQNPVDDDIGRNDVGIVIVIDQHDTDDTEGDTSDDPVQTVDVVRPAFDRFLVGGDDWTIEASMLMSGMKFQDVILTDGWSNDCNWE